MNFFTRFLAGRKGKYICNAPFSQVYIYPDGRVFLCPDCYLNQVAVLGNLNEKSFDEIWNSSNAQFMRREARRGYYPYCDSSYCISDTNFHAKTIPDSGINYELIQKKYPQMVCIGADAECNASCIMCRKGISRLTDEELSSGKKKIEEIYIPILKDAKELTLSTTADPFGSRNTRLLMKTAAEKYPKLKFNLLTNGILCDEFNCKQVGIEDRLNKVMFSIHASNEQTYNDIVKNGLWSRVIQNIEWMTDIKKQKKVKEFYLAFVITSKNYYDIPNFIEFAKKYKAPALFWLCRDWGGNLQSEDENLDIWNYGHPKYRDFCEVLKSIDFNTKSAFFSPELIYAKSHLF